MNIKTRILLSVILLQVTGFALVLLNHQQRATDGILAANQQRIADESFHNMRYLDAQAKPADPADVIQTALTLLQPQTSPADYR